MEDDVDQGGGGNGDHIGPVNGAIGGHPAPPPPPPPTASGGARPKQSSRPRPLADESDDESPSPGALRRINGRPDPRLLLSHSASESDCALDECVYTYKGDRPADVNQNHHRLPEPPPAADGRVSPDLDFLEMDFDPTAFDTSDDELEVAAGWTGAEADGSPPPLQAADVPPPLESPPLRLESALATDGAAALPVASSPSPSPPSPLGSSRSPASSQSRTPSPFSSRASSPGAAVAVAQTQAPAENVKFNRLSAAGSNSDDNLRCSDGGGSPDSNAADVRPGRPPSRRPAEHKVTNRRLARYDLGSSSAPTAPLELELALRLPHSRSEHSAVGDGSEKYQHGCSNDLSDRQPGGCRERLRRRENSVFNIPGAGDPNLQHDGCHLVLEKAFMTRKGAADAADAGLFEFGCDPFEKVMIWTEMEAFTRQVTQIGRSACGATAVINVLLALGYQTDPAEAAAAVSTRLRREAAPLADYLFSRSEAGCTHTQLIEGVEALSGGQVCGRFFCMYPRRSFQLKRWLTGWLRRGAVPVATLNLQRGVPPQQTVPDAWHHQMAFGVGPQGVYLTNPLECVSTSLLGEQLSSDSLLLVRSDDVIARWRHGCSLQSLMTADDPRWRHMNVLGQVVNVLREASDPPPPGVRRALTPHVTIPAWYRSGVTLFMRRSSSHFADLLSEPELPRLEDC